MIRLALAAALLPSIALAQPSLPDRVCVPKSLIEKWAALTVNRPWSEVAVVMDELRAELRAPQPCAPPPETPAKPPAP